jgi:hypothetical protein
MRSKLLLTGPTRKPSKLPYQGTPPELRILSGEMGKRNTCGTAASKKVAKVLAASEGALRCLTHTLWLR